MNVDNKKLILFSSFAWSSCYKLLCNTIAFCQIPESFSYSGCLQFYLTLGLLLHTDFKYLVAEIGIWELETSDFVILSLIKCQFRNEAPRFMVMWCLVRDITQSVDNIMSVQAVLEVFFRFQDGR